jgi:hypothetical protein
MATFQQKGAALAAGPGQPAGGVAGNGRRPGRPGKVEGGFFLFRGGVWANAGWAGVVAFHLGLLLFGWGFWLWGVPALAFLVPSAITQGRQQDRHQKKDNHE